MGAWPSVLETLYYVAHAGLELLTSLPPSPGELQA